MKNNNPIFKPGEHLEIKSDDRGSLIEVFKLPDVGQVFFSTSKPGVIRGNHYHTRKREWFCVIEGEAIIRMKNIETEEIKEYSVFGTNPELVEMPVNWTHNIENTGSGIMKLIAWVNEIFDPNDPDTYSKEI